MAEFHHPHDIDSLPDGTELQTAGRLLRRDKGFTLVDARGEVVVVPADASTPPCRSLVRVTGEWTGQAIVAEDIRAVREPKADSSFEIGSNQPTIGSMLERRADARDTCRQIFERRNFRHVNTPHAVPAPGTDLYIDPVRLASDPPAWLHTSPEFAMKRLLSEGCTRIWQHCRVWRGGEETARHHPEFSMLEWYRAWESADAITDDVETLVTEVCDGEAHLRNESDDRADVGTVRLKPPFERVTMQELVDDVCGFDILQALDYPSLRRAVAEAGLLERSLKRRHLKEDGRWDELFFELMVTELEPTLRDMGAVFVTEWPAPLAVLARKHDDDPRVAERFELFVGGLELANGFVELTDPREQRSRFEQEQAEREALDKPELPLPERFLQALQHGMPPSAGVALGFDRLLMAATGAFSLADVCPFIDPRRNP